MKIIYVYCGEETNIKDPRSYEHYWTSIWKFVNTLLSSLIRSNWCLLDRYTHLTHLQPSWKDYWGLRTPLQYCAWHSYGDTHNTEDQTEESPDALNLCQKKFPNMVAIDLNSQIFVSCSSSKQKAPTYENTSSFLWTNPSLSAYFVGWLNAHFSKFAAAFDLLYPNLLMLLHTRQSRTSYAMC